MSALDLHKYQPSDYEGCNDWETWKLDVWNATVDFVGGYPGLIPYEQQVIRSHDERRCVICGDPGTYAEPSTLVHVRPSYWFCDECHDHYEAKRA